MGFAPETYRDAAEERMTTAVHLYNSGEFAFAIYSAGLAVECILRAYRTSTDPAFDARHRIAELCRQSGFLDVLPPSKAAAIGRSVGVVEAIWRNEHRFRSEAALRRFLNREGLYRRIKGDVLKENARRIVQEATTIVGQGVLRWNR